MWDQELAGEKVPGSEQERMVAERGGTVKYTYINRDKIASKEHYYQSFQNALLNMNQKGANWNEKMVILK